MYIAFVRCVCVPFAIVVFSRLEVAACSFCLWVLFSLEIYSCERSLLSFVCVSVCVCVEFTKTDVLWFLYCLLSDVHIDITVALLFSLLHVSPREQIFEHKHSPFLFKIPHTHTNTHPCAFPILPFLYWNKCKHTCDTEHLPMDTYNIVFVVDKEKKKLLFVLFWSWVLFLFTALKKTKYAFIFWLALQKGIFSHAYCRQSKFLYSFVLFWTFFFASRFRQLCTVCCFYLSHSESNPISFEILDKVFSIHF